jgi:hypothetical protein
MVRKEPSQRSPAYNQRLARGAARGLSVSQSRGHARKHERSISDIKKEATVKGVSFTDIPIVKDVIRTISKTRGNTDFVEILGIPDRDNIRNIIERNKAGHTKIRILHGTKGNMYSSHWVNIDDYDDFMEYDSDYGYGVSSGVTAIAFG